MNAWLNKFLCPGFMALPCKPHPFMNKYYMIADCEKDVKPILWRMKIVEGKDWLKKVNGNWAFQSKWDQMGYTKTINLQLKMMEPIHCTGKVVMGDSGFAFHRVL